MKRGRVGRAPLLVLLTLVLASAGRAPHAPAADPVDPRGKLARLDGQLTPLGGERAGNAEGTIPAWSGGYTQPFTGYRSGGPRPDPFAGEQPRLRISAANMAEHASRLTPGVQTLLRRFPSYRIDVYPTHRTAAAPDWVYKNTRRNIGRARTTDGGVSVADAYGGIPFPIPDGGEQAIWNHLLAWRGESVSYNYSTYVVPAGARVLASAAELYLQFPYYDRSGSPDRFDGIYSLSRTITTAPPFRAGEQLLTIDSLDQANVGRKSWLYLVGQRRVRRVPNIAYDNPSTVSSGFNLFDEIYLFNGAIDRYQWKLVGKQELYVPYNTQRFHDRPVAEALGRDHPNPDHVRWELHRVWVVEATLAPGKRHVLPRRRLYLDEDTWFALLSDGWDAAGNLWHVGHTLPIIAPELPGVVVAPYVIFDLQRGGYVASSLLNEGRRQYQAVEPRPPQFFTPGALSAEGVR